MRSVFEEFDKRFEKRSKSIRRTAIIGTFFGVLGTISILGFLGWVIVKFMAHFGVL